MEIPGPAIQTFSRRCASERSHDSAVGVQDFHVGRGSRFQTEVDERASTAGNTIGWPGSVDFDKPLRSTGCSHLLERSDVVKNIDASPISGHNHIMEVFLYFNPGDGCV